MTPPEITKDQWYEKNVPCVGEEILHMADGGAAKVDLKLALVPSVSAGVSEALGRVGQDQGWGRRWIVYGAVRDKLEDRHTSD